MTAQFSTPSVNISPSLYEQDYYLWLQTTANQLQAGNFLEIDLASLVEEIEDMGKSQRQAVKSNLRVILMHLLKYKYQPERRSNSWRSTLREHRTRLADYFADSPSLKRYFIEVFHECYQKARELAVDETGLSLETFPSESPFTIEETLNSGYLPD
jgi:hypothetical protein